MAEGLFMEFMGILAIGNHLAAEDGKPANRAGVPSRWPDAGWQVAHSP
jgi:hypothetical protein